jgi:hypothetical protein
MMTVSMRYDDLSKIKMRNNFTKAVQFDSYYNTAQFDSSNLLIIFLSIEKLIKTT